MKITKIIISLMLTVGLAASSFAMAPAGKPKGNNVQNNKVKIEQKAPKQNGKVVKVINKGKNGGTMCVIRIQHKDYQSAYYHNKSGSAKVKVGDYVNQGDFIAITGDTGGATGVHLHFQIDKGSNTSSIDPTDYVKGKKELDGLLSLPLGNYIVISPRYVRYGAGTNYGIKKVKELTKDGQKHCVNQKENANAQYKKHEVSSCFYFTTDLSLFEHSSRMIVIGSAYCPRQISVDDLTLVGAWQTSS